MRNFFVYILIFSLFASNFHPCENKDTCLTNEKAAEVHQSCPFHAGQSNEGHSEEEEEKHCSPLCTCSCCQAPIVLGLPTLLPKETSLTLQLTFAHSEEFSFDFVDNIWQPPRLS